METAINYKGLEITISSDYVGTTTPLGSTSKHHTITVETENGSTSFDFICDIYNLRENELCEAFYLFLSDGVEYINSDSIIDFAEKFDYETHTKEDCNQLRNYYGDCRNAFDEWQKIGGGVDIYDIRNWLQEKFDI